MPTDKMPKHVEMVGTKSKSKNGTDKVPTTKKTDKMPTFQLAIYLFVGILSYHLGRGNFKNMQGKIFCKFE